MVARRAVVLIEGELGELPTADTLLGALFENVAGDVASPVNGQGWYNSTTDKFRIREGGVTKDMVGAGGSGASIDDFRREAVIFGAY